MHKRPNLTIIILVIVCLALSTALIVATMHIKSLDKDRAQILHQSVANVQKANEDLNKTTVNYDTACLEYQKLYAAYTELYLDTGARSGQKQYTAPDSAADNPESCYH